MEITPSKKKDKRYKATFKDGKTINFGSKGAKTYVDSATQQTKDAWLARHKVREHWNDPKTAGSLARHILWGSSKSVKENIKTFKKKFNL
jgi:hypothetical protein